MLKIKNATTEIKNAFDELINIQGTAKDRISELEEIVMETSKTKTEREIRIVKQ